MNNKLVFEECIIESVVECENEEYSHLNIKGANISASLPYSRNIAKALKTIMQCDDEKEMEGKTLIFVQSPEGFRKLAVGYQGLYTPIIVGDSSMVLTESELCALMGYFSIVRVGKSGKIITSYDIQIHFETINHMKN